MKGELSTAGALHRTSTPEASAAAIHSSPRLAAAASLLQHTGETAKVGREL